MDAVQPESPKIDGTAQVETKITAILVMRSEEMALTTARLNEMI